MFLFKKNQCIGNYSIVFPHKEGTYAQTYRVRDLFGKVQFMKIILAEKLKPYQFDKDGQVIETKIPEMLAHPNLCKYVDKGSVVYENKKIYYIVTEFVPGENLDSYLKRNRTLSLLEIRQIMKSVLSALNHMHSLNRPIIHNEVTIENILLGLVGNMNNLKLIDFGTARFADLQPDNDSWRKQNLLYIANERFWGEGSEKSDLFSAGVILYKLLFGMMPWEVNLTGLTLQEQVQSILEKRNGSLSIPNVQIIEMDNTLFKVMIKALSPNPAQRFSSAKEFLDALDNKIEIDFAPESMTKKCLEERDIRCKPKIGNGFADVAGMDELKMLMQKKIINVLKNPERAEKFKIQIPNGMLLYGPPGCGKTFIAEKFAEEAGYNYIFVKSSDLASIYIHGAQEKIGHLFEEARKNAPTIINFDEFEALVPNRSKINNTSESGEVNEFLTQMNNCGKDRVFIIASSNRPDLIDPAIRRKGRLDHIIYIPVPDESARESIFRMHMKDRPATDDIDYKKLAKMSQNYVASDIAYIVNDAATRAFEEDEDISQELLELVISENTPSVTEKDLKFYENITIELQNNSQQTKTRNPIGFR